jgi:hypothetical protein
MEERLERLPFVELTFNYSHLVCFLNAIYMYRTFHLFCLIMKYDSVFCRMFINESFLKQNTEKFICTVGTPRNAYIYTQ